MNADFKTWQSAPILQTHGVPMLNGLELVTASDIQPESIGWLVDQWLARGKFHLLAGPAGTGKTTLAMLIMAMFSNGYSGQGQFPAGTFPIAGNVILWTGEDGVADTILPRLMAAGANLDRIHIVRGTLENGLRRAFDFELDMPTLDVAIAEKGNVVLVVIDSIVQAVRGDSNKNSSVRRSLAPLLELGEKYGCAVLGLTHVNKSSKGKEPMDRVTGSLAFVAVARVVWLTARIQANGSDETPSRCVVVRAKSNIGKDDGGYEYQIEQAVVPGPKGPIQTSKVVFDANPLQGSAKAILKYAESGGSFGSSAVEAAQVFLGALLANGGLPFPEIEALAGAQNPPISMAAIKRAKAEMRIESRKQMGAGQSSPHIWYLPTPPDIRLPSTAFVPSAPNTDYQNSMAFHARSPSMAPVQPIAVVPQQSLPAMPVSSASLVEQHWPVSTDLGEPAENGFDGPNGEYLRKLCIEKVCQSYAGGAQAADADDAAAFQDRAIREALDAVFCGDLDDGQEEVCLRTLSRVDWVSALQSATRH